jgi:hypothetical protein
MIPAELPFRPDFLWPDFRDGFEEPFRGSVSDGESTVRTKCRPFEIPAAQAANSVQEFQMEERHWIFNCASAHNFSKFVKGGC